jgi:hypothetical protein
MPRGRVFVEVQRAYSQVYGVPSDKKVSVLKAHDVDDWAVAQNQLTNEVKFVSLSPDGQLLSWDPTSVKKVRPFAEELQGSPGNIGTVRGWVITAPRRDLTIAAGLAPLKSLIDPVSLAPDYLGPPEGQCSCWRGALIGTHVRTADMTIWYGHVRLEVRGCSVLQLATETQTTLFVGHFRSFPDSDSSRITVKYAPNGGLSLMLPNDATDGEKAALRKFYFRLDGNVEKHPW